MNKTFETVALMLAILTEMYLNDQIGRCEFERSIHIKIELIKDYKQNTLR